MSLKTSLLLVLPSSLASSRGLVFRQKGGGGACPNVHVFGAREPTAPPSFGTADTVVDLILAAVPGSTSEATDYPGRPAGSDISSHGFREPVSGHTQLVLVGVLLGRTDFRRRDLRWRRSTSGDQ
ncbi:hypothetical protein AJ80_07027 [Polytolypa hystricis UAMH7299]|uniref:Uncharacterized protein n=1 Tax=Polytolypa hystricis (strain UAMH7299) TaxID=1447883 RepID=A0A2B7XRQ5_POLH7|nr:hypothetical protein AJ80_07027 [Polytolypa hystricis UAMH7299]